MLAALLLRPQGLYTSKRVRFRKPDGETTESSTEAVLAWQAFHNLSVENVPRASREITRIRRIMRQTPTGDSDEDEFLFILSII